MNIITIDKYDEIVGIANGSMGYNNNSSQYL